MKNYNMKYKLLFALGKTLATILTLQGALIPLKINICWVKVCFLWSENKYQQLYEMTKFNKLKHLSVKRKAC